MVRIRLARVGYKQAPFYHIVVTDSRNARDCGFIERIGFFNPIEFDNKIMLHINIERIKYWLHKGANPSTRVSTLLKRFIKDK